MLTMVDQHAILPRQRCILYAFTVQCSSSNGEHAGLNVRGQQTVSPGIRRQAHWECKKGKS